MGCCQSKPLFSTLLNQREIVDALVQEKTKYVEELERLEKKKADALANSVSGTNQAANEENSEQNKEVLAERAEREALGAFVYGITVIEIELKSKEFNDIPGLGKILDNYFNLATGIKKGNEEQVKNETAAINQWLANHLKLAQQ